MNIREQIREVYKYLYKNLDSKNFSEVDLYLKTTSTDTTAISCAILTITAPYKMHLTERKTFFDRAKSAIGKEAEQILVGLE